ncbi:MAG: hypothetical protein JO097_08865 [Acidobacteriaceae bacterium]|nr:hypothetical protein [Acidobacteriaceae bacterium]MBV9296415.1 hypothetical protein [Acidobacteriaceae bacterium]MBV9764373.1 hypothetical protein [Acidobacteriaceae bacterium]
MEYAEHLIQRILDAPDHSRVAVLANELLREFQRGYSVERLRPLLASYDGGIVATAAWIASELAETARPLLSEVVPLLKHPAKRVRFHALDCLFWASIEQGSELAAAFRLLGDADSGVRWKAMHLLASLSAEKLRAGLRFLAQSEGDAELARGLSWLISSEAERPEMILAALGSDDAIMRRFAALAAARNRTELLGDVSTSGDDEVSEFARGKMRLAQQSA